MTIRTLIMLAGLFVVPALTVNASSYFGASAGYFLDDEEEFLTLRVGYDFSEKENFRHSAEFEVGYVSESDQGVNLDTIPVMVNYKLTVPTNKKVSFYLGGGLGVSFMDLSGYGRSLSDEPFTMQAFLGLEVFLREGAYLLIGYRYIFIDSPRFVGRTVDDLEDSTIEVGINFPL